MDSLLSQAQAKLNEQLANLPEGKRGAFVVVAHGEGEDRTISAGLAGRINSHWVLAADFETSLAKFSPSFEIESVVSW